VKFTVSQLVREVGAHGFDLQARWLDSGARYGIFFFRRRKG